MNVSLLTKCADFLAQLIETVAGRRYVEWNVFVIIVSEFFHYWDLVLNDGTRGSHVSVVHSCQLIRHVYNYWICGVEIWYQGHGVVLSASGPEITSRSHQFLHLRAGDHEAAKVRGPTSLFSNIIPHACSRGLEMNADMRKITIMLPVVLYGCET